MLGVDPVIIRVLWVILMFTFGFGFLAYIVAWVIIPTEPLEYSGSQTENQSKEGRVDIFESQSQPGQGSNPMSKNITLIVGIAILVLGLVTLITSFFGVTGWLLNVLSKMFWPSILIAVGIVIIYYYSKRN